MDPGVEPRQAPGFAPTMTPDVGTLGEGQVLAQRHTRQSPGPQCEEQRPAFAFNIHPIIYTLRSLLSKAYHIARQSSAPER